MTNNVEAIDGFVVRYNEFKNEIAKVIVGQKEIIETKNKNVTDSINYARTIQESVLPSKLILNNYFNDNFIYYNPRDIVSGDFYWFKQNDEYMIIALRKKKSEVIRVLDHDFRGHASWEDWDLDLAYTH